MNSEMIIALINNAALLLSIGVLYDVFVSNVEINTHLKSIISGILIGLIGIALMLNPWELSFGLFFDTRSILLSVVSLFFGFVPAITGALIIALYRLYLGGVGTLAGISVTLTSVILGLFWKRNNEKLQKYLGIFDFYVFGLLVHIVMLFCMLLLPWPFAFEVLKNISFPVMLIYPIGTMLLGNLLKNHLSRRITQDALKEKESMLQDFINNVPVGMFRINSDGTIIQINPEMTKILGLDTIEETIDYLEYMGKIDHNSRSRTEILGILKEQGFVENYEYEALRADGKQIWILINIKMSDERNGDSFIVDGFVFDITERKQAEKQMLLARISAEDANRFKSHLLSNMNHELRTPLNSILGFSDIMIEGTTGELNKEQEKYLQIIYNSGKSLLNLVNQVLDLSEIECGSLEFKPELITIKNVIEDVQKRAKFLSSKKNISIDSSIEENIPIIKADFNKFRGIIFNLVENAIKFTPEDGRVNIIVRKKDNSLEISVIDSGIGITDEDIKKIFMPFVQADDSTTRKYGGAGLGLTLVKEYVKMHGGTLQVESEVGKGSTFTISLPLDELTY
ncbi:PAS domain S-box-containing protein [Methanolobus vulcani]|jgi:PAS domain S-box-containing protein|uniref:histidine kinase n=1 Tax=Methanolobus vulcani TaxID=38026 RepID=A0A7Z7AYY7_9EURY|nr:ATP-binding protein [Methanolobus vulcani]MDK2947219.1 hypothetical protein [Methanolobus sp.]SDG25279.1 PAS domain S-box-containing protein [Methanolobus vulcani]